MPELCRRQLTLTCLDNDDVLPVTQLQHLTWCTASRLHTLPVPVSVLLGMHDQKGGQHAIFLCRKTSRTYLFFDIGDDASRMRCLVLQACVYFLKEP